VSLVEATQSFEKLKQRGDASGAIRASMSARYFKIRINSLRLGGFPGTPPDVVPDPYPPPDPEPDGPGFPEPDPDPAPLDPDPKPVPVNYAV
jgi:hypothetical protein